MDEVTKKILEIIEKDLSDIPGLEAIAQELGISRYYLSRSFKMDIGESYTQYVKRRRIAEATKEVLAHNRRIIDIALDYGYSSHEAFQRTFKNLHNQTPARAHFHHSQLFKRSALDIEPKETPISWQVMEYGPVKLHAIGREFSYQNLMAIERFWQDFHHKHGVIKGGTYGLSLPPRSKSVESFYYLIGYSCDLSAVDSLVVEIPKRRYAVFTHQGSVDKLINTLNYIWGQWLFENPHIRIQGMDFEYYPEGFDPYDDNSTCQVFVPVSMEG
ncbi:helix-turn-helix domain-containing protein [Marinomonas agarivorans]|nr:helix-turn-helix domain-containing protein [Marinomonas agarivorans]